MSHGWTILVPESPGWSAEVDALWAGLDQSGGPVVPTHFVKTTFVKIGGRLATHASGGVGLLFPRGVEDGRRVYTLRLQGRGDVAALEALIAPDRLLAYEPARPEPLTYQPTHVERGAFVLGAPAASELAAIRALHAAIWGEGSTARYPDDLHSAEFGPATSLVARRDGRVIGFLLGFYRFALPALTGLGLPFRLDLGVESQVMGVTAEARRSGLAAALKREQARQVLAQGLDLIHWTVDPLQYPNAVLNFARLGAVAGEHYEAYYPFQNRLNRVPASRLGLVWLPRSARGRSGMAEQASRAGRDLRDFPGCKLLNNGPVPLGEPAGAPFLALAIPADWTALQRDDLALAARWRATTDRLLARYLGFAAGRYLVVDGAREGETRYLVLQRYERGLLL